MEGREVKERVTCCLITWLIEVFWGMVNFFINDIFIFFNDELNFKFVIFFS